MRKEDIINKCEKVIYDKYDVTFIIKTDGESDFWYWIVNRQDIRDYFKEIPSAVLELDRDKLTQAHCERFINDVANEFCGCSCASFATIEDALKDIKG